MSIIKTLKGKNNYLFLINDNVNSLKRHTEDSQNLNIKNLDYKKLIKNYIILVFPDKEIICKSFLPDNFYIKYRTDIDMYKSILKDRVIDPTNILEPTDYYKTDSHINNNGSLKIFKLFVEYISQLFKLKVKYPNILLKKKNVESLNSINKGIGDLTWDINKGNLLLNDINDIYYSFSEEYDFYMTAYEKNDKRFKIINYELNDVSSDYNFIDWNVISTNILYRKTENAVINKKILIFYDSFLVSSIGLYKELFQEIYLVKNFINNEIIKKINPDFVFEFRVERFL